jgi:2-phosphosulpholactate phosphatase
VWKGAVSSYAFPATRPKRSSGRSPKGVYLRRTGSLGKAQAEADGWQKDFDRWVKLTLEGLKSVFAGDAAAEEVESAARLWSYSMYDSWSERHERWIEVLGQAMNALISLRERLVFAKAFAEPPGPTPATGTNIFVVHGHDETAKETVARFLEKVAEPGVIVLSEQPEVDEALALRDSLGEPALLGGERSAVRIEGFDAGASPREFLEPRAETLILSTTNGTRAILAAAARCGGALRRGAPRQPAQSGGDRRRGARPRGRREHPMRRISGAPSQSTTPTAGPDRGPAGRRPD